MVNDETKDDHKLSFFTDIKFGIDVFFKDYYLEKKPIYIEVLLESLKHINSLK